MTSATACFNAIFIFSKYLLLNTEIHRFGRFNCLSIAVHVIQPVDKQNVCPTLGSNPRPVALSGLSMVTHSAIRIVKLH